MALIFLFYFNFNINVSANIGNKYIQPYYFHQFQYNLFFLVFWPIIWIFHLKELGTLVSKQIFHVEYEITGQKT